MGNFALRNIIWDLDRPGRAYYAGETVTGSVYVAKPISFERRTTFISYAIQASYYKPTKSSKPKLIRRWLYSTTKALPTSYYELPGGVDLSTVRGRIEIQLPTGVPPVIYCKKGIPLIAHVLQLSHDGRLDANLDGSSSVMLIVYPRLNVTSLPRWNRIVEGGQEHKSVQLRASINTGAVVPGDNIVLNYKIKNPRASLIETLTIELVQAYSLELTAGERVLLTMVAPEIRRECDQMIRGQLLISLPNYAFPPTTNYFGRSAGQCRLTIDYYVRCTLAIKSFRRGHLLVQLPLVIGNEPSRAEDARGPIGFARQVAKAASDDYVYPTMALPPVLWRRSAPTEGPADSQISSSDSTEYESVNRISLPGSVDRELSPSASTQSLPAPHKNLLDTVASGASKLTHSFSMKAGRKMQHLRAELHRGSQEQAASPCVLRRPQENEYAIVGDDFAKEAKRIVDGRQNEDEDPKRAENNEEDL